MTTTTTERMTPSITIAVPSHSTPKPKPSPPPRLSTPTSATAPLTSFSSTTPRSCYLCDEQNPGDFSPTTRFLEPCQLCSRDFCPIHKDVVHEQVCNINHSCYYHEQLEQARREVAKTAHRVSPKDRRDGVFDESEAEEILMRAGIFPSVGEREKMVWSSTPVSDAKMREIENFRSIIAAEMRGAALIETKEFIGADIAV